MSNLLDMFESFGFADNDHILKAINCLKQFEPEDKGYYLAFSGGKDSIIIKQLAIEANVKFDAHYNVTTVDPPELVKFIRDYHPDVIFDKPKTNMMELIIKNRMLPTRLNRFCCKDLKERGGDGRRIITGVRWAESQNRLNKRRQVELWTFKSIINPIISWSNEDVWNFIHDRKLPYCSLYDEGFKRIGCVACPNSHQRMKYDLIRWPKYKKYYLTACKKCIDKQREDGHVPRYPDAEAMLNWWISNVENKKTPCNLYE